MSHTPEFTAQPYQGIATFGRRPFDPQGAGADVAIVGVPYDSATTYRSGARLGPRAIREQSLLLWGYNNALRVNPFETLRIVDAGDVDVVPVSIEATQRAIQSRVEELRGAGAKVLLVGGDHSISLPSLRGHASTLGEVAVVHFDAHPDTWNEEFPGHRYSHGTPFRRALEERLIAKGSYVQVGLRGPTAGPGDYEQARELGARVLTADAVYDLGMDGVLEEIHEAVRKRPVYVTLDIDVVDPAFAPGTGTPEVGGLTSRQILQLVRGLKGLNLVGCDVVEVAPAYDPAGITAILAANLAFEFLSLWGCSKGGKKRS
jgi:agmatinase/guanidinopropionase